MVTFLMGLVCGPASCQAIKPPAHFSIAQGCSCRKSQLPGSPLFDERCYDRSSLKVGFKEDTVRAKPRILHRHCIL